MNAARSVHPMTDPTFVFGVGLDFTGADRNLLRQLCQVRKIGGITLRHTNPGEDLQPLIAQGGQKGFRDLPGILTR